MLVFLLVYLHPLTYIPLFVSCGAHFVFILVIYVIVVFTYNIELDNFRMGDKIIIKEDKQAPIIEFKLLSILFVNLYPKFLRSSANVGIPFDTNILIILGLEMQSRQRNILNLQGPMKSVLNVFNFPILIYMCHCHYYFQCVSHGYLPSALIKTTIVPNVKNKAADLSDSDNYRHIAIATITSKLLESILLLKCSDYLTTCDNPFVFKASHGTDMCISTLKEFISYYKCRDTTV